ncbi:MAG TPA: PepSY-associated TM helix domain-containing protein [Burkholderiaceae bacterium]|nr:PepSY-associated TM helix domain-containing protein [Burkholderiaceae bacterium]
MRARSKWFIVHRWLGIGLGVWFALVGLSGAILVFEDPIDAWLNPHLLTTVSRGTQLSAQAIVARAEAAYPLGLVEKIRFPASEDEVYRLTMRVKPRRVGAERIEAMFDPMTGVFLGARSLESLGVASPDVMRTLYEFHRNVLLGNAGSNIVGIAGLLLLTSAVTGFVLAAPRTRAALRRIVWVNPRTSFTRIAYDFHRSTGIVFAVTLLLATLTGATLVYVNYVRDLVGVFSKVAPFPTVPWQMHSTNVPLQLDRVIADVKQRFPEHTLLEVHGSPRQMAGHLYYLKKPGDVHRLGDTIAWINPLSGEMMIERSPRTRTAGEGFMHWLFPLHSGTAFGTAGQITMAATGVVPMLLVITGLWVWLRKRRGERISRERQSLRRAVVRA